MAQSGRDHPADTCPLLGVERTCAEPFKAQREKDLRFRRMADFQSILDAEPQSPCSDHDSQSGPMDTREEVDSEG